MRVPPASCRLLGPVKGNGGLTPSRASTATPVPAKLSLSAVRDCREAVDELPLSCRLYVCKTNELVAVR